MIKNYSTLYSSLHDSSFKILFLNAKFFSQSSRRSFKNHFTITSQYLFIRLKIILILFKFHLIFRFTSPLVKYYFKTRNSSRSSARNLLEYHLKTKHKSIYNFATILYIYLIKNYFNNSHFVPRFTMLSSLHTREPQSICEEIERRSKTRTNRKLRHVAVYFTSTSMLISRHRI